MDIRPVVLATGLALLAAAPLSADSWERGRPNHRGPAVGRSYSGFATPHYAQLGYDSGYRDGYEKGRGDARNRKDVRYDPGRHKWFKSASRGYKNHYGVKPAYQQVYRSGFQSGYDAAFHDLLGPRAFGGYAGRPRPGFGGVDFRWGW